MRGTCRVYSRIARINDGASLRCYVSAGYTGGCSRGILLSDREILYPTSHGVAFLMGIVLLCRGCDTISRRRSITRKNLRVRHIASDDDEMYRSGGAMHTTQDDAECLGNSGESGDHLSRDWRMALLRKLRAKFARAYLRVLREILILIDDASADSLLYQVLRRNSPIFLESSLRTRGYINDLSIFHNAR